MLRGSSFVKKDGKSHLHKKFRHKRKAKGNKGGKALLKIFTDEQKQIYLKLLAAKRERKKEHFKKQVEQKREQRIKHLTAVLDLSEEQQKQLRQIFATVRDDIPGKEHDSLKNKGQRTARHKKIRHLLNKKIEAILNEEQLAKFKELQKEQKQRFHKKDAV